MPARGRAVGTAGTQRPAPFHPHPPTHRQPCPYVQHEALRDSYKGKQFGIVGPRIGKLPRDTFERQFKSLHEVGVMGGMCWGGGGVEE